MKKIFKKNDEFTKAATRAISLLARADIDRDGMIRVHLSESAYIIPMLRELWIAHKIGNDKGGEFVEVDWREFLTEVAGTFASTTPVYLVLGDIIHRLENPACFAMETSLNIAQATAWAIENDEDGQAARAYGVAKFGKEKLFLCARCLKAFYNAF